MRQHKFIHEGGILSVACEVFFFHKASENISLQWNNVFIFCYKNLKIFICTYYVQGNLVPKKSIFPSGMKALADYVHSKGLKIGIYGDAGYLWYCFPSFTFSEVWSRNHGCALCSKAILCVDLILLLKQADQMSARVLMGPIGYSGKYYLTYWIRSSSLRLDVKPVFL